MFSLVDVKVTFFLLFVHPRQSRSFALMLLCDPTAAHTSYATTAEDDTLNLHENTHRVR